MSKKKNPNPFTTVTPFSKALALSLFILLPVLTFYLGLKLQRIYDQTAQIIQSQPTRTISPEPKTQVMTTCTQDADCTLTPSDNIATNSPMALCCGLNSCKAAEQVVAVNTSWLREHKTNICGTQPRACPMLRVYCPSPPQANYQAKCISNICHVVTK